MKRQGDNDELNRFFRNKLTGGDAHEEDWNVPSDGVWESAAAALQEDKRKRKGFFWIWGGLGLLVVFLGMGALFFLQLDQRFDQVDERIQAIQEQVKKSNQSQNNGDLNTESAIDNPIKNKSQEGNANFQNKGYHSNNSSIPNTKFKNQNPIIQRNEENANPYNNNGDSFTKKPPQNGIANNANTPVGNHSESQHEPPKEHNLTPPQASLETDGNEGTAPPHLNAPLIHGLPLTQPQIAEWEMEEDSEARNNRPNSPWGLELNYAPSLTAAPIVGDMSGRFGNLWGYHELQYAQRASLLGVYRLNSRWSVLTGLSYNELSSCSGNDGAVMYDEATAFFNADNQIMNRIHLNLASPMGDVEGEVMVQSFEDLGLQSGDMLDSKVMMSQKTRFISVPLSLRYEHPIAPKWAVLAQGGADWNRIIMSDTRLQADLSYYGQRLDKAYEVVKDFSSLQKSTFTYHAHLGATYTPHPSWQLKLSTRYTGNIAPVMEQSGIKTRWRELGLETGIQFRF